jgi:exopolysaccharide production protein ExoQ
MRDATEPGIPSEPHGLSRRLEDGYLVAVVLLVLGWVVPLAHSLAIGSVDFTGDALQEGARARSLQEGTPAFQLLIGACYGISGLALLRRIRPGRLPAAVLLVLAPVVFALASWTWSETPAITARRSIGLAGTLVIAAHLGLLCDWARLRVLLLTACAIAVASSLAASLLFPAWAVHQSGVHEGNWRGLFIQKNSAGSAMVIALAVAGSIAIESAGRLRAVALGVALLAVAGAVASGSRTAWLLALMAGALIGWTALQGRSRMAGAIAALLLATVMASGAVAVHEAFASAPRLEDARVLGRDITATGRWNIWQLLGPLIAERPIIGYGFRGFWSGQGPSGEIWSAMGWEPANAHSSWVDTLVELGAVGLALVLALLVAYAVLLRRSWGGAPIGARAWLLAILVVTVVQGMGDTTILEPNGPLWTMLLVGFFVLLRRPAVPA